MSITLLAAPIDSLRAASTPFNHDQLVSRGDFIRAAMRELNIRVPAQESYSIQYTRVPASMQPFVQVAHDLNALDAFGDDLRLAFPITRGEALRFVVELQGVSSSKGVSFRDVRRGTMEEKAVKVVIDKGWMEPLRDNLFGVERRLTGSLANMFLARVTGQGNTPQGQQEMTTLTPQTVQVNIRGRGVNTTSHIPNAKLIDTIWQLIGQDFLYQEQVDETEASYSAIESIVGSLDDPYSRFMRPKAAQNFQTQIQGEVSGIGAQVEDRDGILTIVTPLTGSPAEKAGLKPNDKIIKVDGEDIRNMGFMDAVNKVRGPVDSTVELTIDRNGIIINVTVVRDKVRVPEISISWQRRVAIVKLMQFGKHTETELRGLMEDVQEQNPSGIIMDLRNNPGGLLHAADVVLSNFLPKGSSIAIIKSRDSEVTDKTDLEPTINSSVPMIVLINEGSASASEIVAGALQDHGRARTLGMKSFGKGTVQEVLEFVDHSSLKLTIAEWLTPNGRKINGVGLQPDIEVKYESSRDVQLIRALELLR